MANLGGSMAVQGVGGFFFRAQDPDALKQWYSDHLGVGAGHDATGAGAHDEWSWTVQGGPMVFAPFEATTDYWPAGQQVMLNLRVSELDALIARLRADGVEVTTDTAWDSPEAGHFARVSDPEGNVVELWEP